MVAAYLREVAALESGIAPLEKVVSGDHRPVSEDQNQDRLVVRGMLKESARGCGAAPALGRVLED